MIDSDSLNLLLLLVAGFGAAILLINALLAPQRYGKGWLAVAVFTFIMIAWGRQHFPAHVGFVAAGWFLVTAIVPGYLARRAERPVERSDAMTRTEVVDPASLTTPFVPVVTIVLLILIALMFLAEYLAGGVESEDALWKLGALNANAVRAGQWWRLLAFNFLHDGFAHIMFNGWALWIMGPFVERGLGRLRYLVTYLAAGIGGGVLIVLVAGHGQRAQLDTLVGASGCIMGLIGAAGAILLRGWRTKATPLARARLRSLVSIIVMQFIFDQLVPQISSTAHLFGMLIGFAVAWMIQPVGVQSAEE